VSDNKSEGVGTNEIRLESSSAIDAGAESISRVAVANESRPTPVKSGTSNGGARPGREKAAAAEEPDESLGAFLIAARERHGFTANDVVRETRLPLHYLRMMETNDYSEISDQLYLVPFLRRYASFLDLDQEDVAMRFVREVQRADSSPPARLYQPLIAEPRRRRGWTGGILVLGLLTVVVAIYLYESDRHRQASADVLAPHASASVPTSSDASGSSVAPQAP
jgi:hypothetical protein